MPGIFSTGPIIWVSMDLPRPQQSYLRQLGPRGQILAPNLKIAIFSQNITIWVSMDLPGPQQSYLRQFGPWGQALGPRAQWSQIKKCNFLTNPNNMGVYGLA